MTNADFYWLHNLPYNNGVDPEIKATGIVRPMTPHAWLMRQQPKTEECVPLNPPAPRPLTTGKDLYGMRGMPVRSSAPLLDQVGFDQHRPGVTA